MCLHILQIKEVEKVLIKTTLTKIYGKNILLFQYQCLENVCNIVSMYIGYSTHLLNERIKQHVCDI